MTARDSVHHIFYNTTILQGGGGPPNLSPEQGPPLTLYVACFAVSALVMRIFTHTPSGSTATLEDIPLSSQVAFCVGLVLILFWAPGGGGGGAGIYLSLSMYPNNVFSVEGLQLQGMESSTPGVGAAILACFNFGGLGTSPFNMSSILSPKQIKIFMRYRYFTTEYYLNWCNLE